MTKKRINYSKETVEEWFKEYNNGKSFKQVGEVFKVSAGIVARRLRDFGFIDNENYHMKIPKTLIPLYREAKDFYTDGNSLTETLKKFDIVSKAVSFRNYLTRCGVKIRGMSEAGSYVTNHDFFSNIDSEIKAYLLGFFAADGHIEKRQDYDSYTLRIGVNPKDVHIVMLYNRELTNGRSAIRINKSGSQATVAITSKQLGEDLLKLGFDNQKTYTWKTLPKLSNDMYPHFIRGLFDGDGSIMLDTRRVGNRLSGFNRRFNLTCYNKSILEELHKIIGVEFHYTSKGPIKTTVNGKEAVFKGSNTIECWKLEELQKLHKYLYENATYYFLRKKYKFDLAIMNDKDCYASLQGNL